MANDYMAKLAADLDGMTMGGLASKGRYGDTMIAHINPQEAEMLMEEGGSGTINPMTGLPEFFDWADDSGGMSFDESSGDIDYSGGAGTGGGGASGGDTGGGVMDAEDAEAYTQAAIEDPDIPLSAIGSVDDIADVADQFGLTIEEAAEFLGPTGVGRGGSGEFEGFGVGRSGDTIGALNRSFNKEGIPQEFVPYYNSLKDRGLSNEQAMATLAAVAGTPGGAGALSSGYTDGYSYGGPMGTLEDLIETGQTASLEQRAKKAREEAAKKEQEVGYLAGGIETETKQGFGDRFASMLGLDDFSLDSLNPLSTTVSPKDQAVLDSYSAQGLEVKSPSVMGNILGGIGSSLLSTPIAVAKYVGEQLTDTDIIGLATDPVTGFEYLIESGGGLQLAADQLGDAPNQDAGNEPTPTITKKRKEETKSDPEDITKNVNKPGFPQQKLPRLTPFGQTELANIYGSDDPLFNKYATGIQALV